MVRRSAHVLVYELFGTIPVTIRFPGVGGWWGRWAEMRRMLAQNMTKIMAVSLDLSSPVTIVRPCSHLPVILEHFERAALSNGPAPMYDQRLATAFPDQGMVYRWNLLQVCLPSGWDSELPTILSPPPPPPPSLLSPRCPTTAG